MFGRIFSSRTMVEQILKSVLEAQGIRLEDYKKNAA